MRRLLTIGSLLMAATFGVFVIVASAQSSPANPSSPRPAESKPAPEKSPEAQSAAKPKAHHFDRVLIIVLENADYEVAVRDKNLQVGIVRHRFAQGLGHIQVAVLGGAVIPG